MYIGVDIGGTKCAVIKARINESGVLCDKKRIEFKTQNAKETLERIIKEIEELMPCEAIGISCGGPLDEELGVIKSPPNLPGWDNICIKDILFKRFGVPVLLRNDANASALAEHRFGAGKGVSDMVFLTFGTGLGAGIIINGKLYSGACGNAGEVGHIRLSQTGPVGYGKMGSFEGFCSGGGISQLGQMRAREGLKKGKELFGCKNENDISRLTAKAIAEFAERGDQTALEIYRESGIRLGEGLAVIIDALNPEAVIIGSIYERCSEYLRDGMYEVLSREALEANLKACKILPASLGDEIGDYAAISVAMECNRQASDSLIDRLIRNYPELSEIQKEIRLAAESIVECYRRGGKLLLCGNGGSAADCEHVAGELLKGFLSKRTPQNEEMTKLHKWLGEDAEKLQGGIAAIPLPSISGALSAFANDVEPSLVYAQLVYALGRKGDLLFAFSTSGNSKNVVSAAKTAKATGMKVIAFTGRGGGMLSEYADILIASPESETFMVQEHHLPIYHAICAEAEKAIFKKEN